MSTSHRLTRNLATRNQLTIAAIGVGYVLLAWLVDGGFLLAPSIRFNLAAGIVIPLVLLFGPLAIVGICLGHVCYGLISGSSLEGTLVVVTGYLVGALVGYLLWGRLGRLSAGHHPGHRSLRGIGEYVILSIIAAAAVGATAGVGDELLGIRPFFVTILTTAPTFLVSSIVCGIIILGIAGSFSWESHYQHRGTTRFSILLAWVPIGWLLLGSIGSFGFLTGRRVPAWMFERFGVEPLLLLLDEGLFGQGALRVQLLLGAVVISLILAAFVVDQRKHTSDL